MKKAIVTFASGDEHKAILAETIGLMREYAERIGAEFIVNTKPDDTLSVPHYNKLQILSGILKRFDRVAWIDCDVLISKKAPSIFDEVPEGKFGIFNEAPWVDRSKDAEDWANTTGFLLPEQTYFNTGVMVVEKKHADIFKLPDLLINHYGEQTYLNQKIIQSGCEIHKLSYHWNRMSCTHYGLGEEPFVSHFIHFAGETKNPHLPKFIQQTVKYWKDHNWKGERTIVVVCNNGMGNQIATVPVIQYLAEQHPDYEILITSSFPEVYQHLKSSRLKIIEPDKDQPMSKFALYKSTALFGTIQDVATHPTEFHSISLVHRQLPANKKRVSVPVKSCGIKFPENTIAIHAGRSAWDSKEMPEENWQAICDQLRDCGHKIAIIGTKKFDKKNAGVPKDKKYWGCFVPKGVDYDMTDIPFEQTCDVIQQCKFLLSNDSMPVHAAGAFDNWIGLITIAKRPELIFPYRQQKNFYGTENGWKTMAWTGTPLWEVTKEPVIAPPDSQFDWSVMHEGMKWPEPELVVNGIRRLLSGT